MNALRLHDASQQFNRMDYAVVLFVSKMGDRTAAITGCIAGVRI